MATVEYPNEPRALSTTIGQLSVFFLFSLVSSIIVVWLLSIPLGPIVIDQYQAGAEYLPVALFGFVFAGSAASTELLLQSAWGESSDDNEVTMRHVKLFGVAVIVNVLYFYTIISLAVLLATVVPAYSVLVALGTPLAARALVRTLGPSISYTKITMPFAS
jgi:hypothetical protein